jgi:5'-nucleotidase
MSDNKLILLTNDDGIDSPGLWAAAHALAPLGTVTVVAPKAQCTSVGRSMPATHTGVIDVREFSFNGARWIGYAADATPALAVMHGMLEILPRRPDLVVAGINYGENIGSAVMASGTVGAAMEGADFGVPALAVSQETGPEYYHSHSREIDFTAAAYFTHLFAEKLLRQRLPPDVDVLKVDVPLGATPDAPWQMTRLSRTRYYTPVKPQRTHLSDPGRIVAENHLDTEHVEPDSDVNVVIAARQVSVTPLSLDLTSRVSLADLGRLLNG